MEQENSLFHQTGLSIRMKSLVFILAVLIGVVIASRHSTRGLASSRVTFSNPRTATNVRGGCPRRPKIPNTITALSTTVIERLTARLQETIRPCNGTSATSTATALSFSVVLGNVSTEFINLGCTESGTANAPTAHTIYRLASVSKTFSVKAALDAVETGLIRSLDDEVRQYVPDFYLENVFTNEQPTWRQLMSQQAGLPRDSPCDPLNCSVTTDDVLRRLARQRLLFPPYERASYSNVAFSVLGHVIAERLRNQTFETLLSGITEVLKMDSTGVDLTPAVLQRMPAYYTRYDIPVPVFSLHWDNPAGGIYSTTRDLARWLRHFLGRWQRSALYKQNMQPLFVEGSGNTAWGAPWEIEMSHPAGYMVRTKGGYIPGVSTIIAMVPELDLGFTVLWNGEGMDTMRVAMDLFNAVLHDVVVDQFEATDASEFPPAGPGFADKFLGLYGVPAALDLIHANVTKDAAGIVHLSAPGFGSFLLRPSGLAKDGDLVFQVFLHTSHYDACVEEGFAAYVGEWVTFSLSTATGVPQFRIPGYFDETFVHV